MELKMLKQPSKYMKSLDKNTKKKLDKALYNLSSFNGNIIKLNKKNEYRYKIDHYRIIFFVDEENNIIVVKEINTRTNIKY